MARGLAEMLWHPAHGRAHRRGLSAIDCQPEYLGGSRADRVQPRHPADSLRSLLCLPRPRRHASRGRSAARRWRTRPRRRPSSPASRTKAKSSRASPTTDPELRMPPADSGKSLSTAEDRIAHAWIADGAEYQTHWAYVQPRRRPVPSVVEHGVAAQLDRQLYSRPATGRGARAVARGRPRDAHPPAELRPDRPAARARGGRRLRERRRRPAPTSGSSTDCSPPRISASGWRSTGSIWCATPTRSATTATRIRASRRIATTSSTPSTTICRSTASRASNWPATCCPIPDIEQKIASGYNRLLQTSHEGGVQPKEYLAIYAADRVRNVSAVWMGATMGCCQCHDHKFDPYTSHDFYALAAFFADVDEEHHFKDGDNSLPTKRLPGTGSANRTATAATRRTCGARDSASVEAQRQSRPLTRSHEQSRWSTQARRTRS